jgi:3-hydroxyacyl-CoA dehydrogenase
MVHIAVVGSGRVGGEVAFVSVPAGVARSLEPDIWDLVTKKEKKALKTLRQPFTGHIPKPKEKWVRC